MLLNFLDGRIRNTSFISDYLIQPGIIFKGNDPLIDFYESDFYRDYYSILEADIEWDDDDDWEFSEDSYEINTGASDEHAEIVYDYEDDYVFLHNNLYLTRFGQESFINFDDTEFTETYLNTVYWPYYLNHLKLYKIYFWTKQKTKCIQFSYNKLLKAYINNFYSKYHKFMWDQIIISSFIITDTYLRNIVNLIKDFLYLNILYLYNNIFSTFQLFIQNLIINFFTFIITIYNNCWLNIFWNNYDLLHIEFMNVVNSIRNYDEWIINDPVTKITHQTSRMYTIDIYNTSIFKYVGNFSILRIIDYIFVNVSSIIFYIRYLSSIDNIIKNIFSYLTEYIKIIYFYNNYLKKKSVSSVYIFHFFFWYSQSYFYFNVFIPFYNLWKIEHYNYNIISEQSHLAFFHIYLILICLIIYPRIKMILLEDNAFLFIFLISIIILWWLLISIKYNIYAGQKGPICYSLSSCDYSQNRYRNRVRLNDSWSSSILKFKTYNIKTSYFHNWYAEYMRLPNGFRAQKYLWFINKSPLHYYEYKSFSSIQNRLEINSDYQYKILSAIPPLHKADIKKMTKDDFIAHMLFNTYLKYDFSNEYIPVLKNIISTDQLTNKYVYKIINVIDYKICYSNKYSVEERQHLQYLENFKKLYKPSIPFREVYINDFIDISWLRLQAWWPYNIKHPRYIKAHGWLEWFSNFIFYNPYKNLTYNKVDLNSKKILMEISNNMYIEDYINSIALEYTKWYTKRLRILLELESFKRDIYIYKRLTNIIQNKYITKNTNKFLTSNIYDINFLIKNKFIEFKGPYALQKPFSKYGISHDNYPPTYWYLNINTQDLRYRPVYKVALNINNNFFMLDTFFYKYLYELYNTSVYRKKNPLDKLNYNYYYYYKTAFLINSPNYVYEKHDFPINLNFFSYRHSLKTSHVISFESLLKDLLKSLKLLKFDWTWHIGDLNYNNMFEFFRKYSMKNPNPSLRYYPEYEDIHPVHNRNALKRIVWSNTPLNGPFLRIITWRGSPLDVPYFSLEPINLKLRAFSFQLKIRTRSALNLILAPIDYINSANYKIHLLNYFSKTYSQDPLILLNNYYSMINSKTLIYNTKFTSSLNSINTNLDYKPYWIFKIFNFFNLSYTQHPSFDWRLSMLEYETTSYYNQFLLDHEDFFDSNSVELIPSLNISEQKSLFNSNFKIRYYNSDNLVFVLTDPLLKVKYTILEKDGKLFFCHKSKNNF